MERTIKAAAIQMAAKPGDLPATMRNIQQLVEKAASEGADFVLLPELCNVGYDLALVKELTYDYEKALADFGALSRQYGLFLAAGILEERDNKKYNTLAVFDPRGNLVATYRKINLFPLSREEALFVPGDSLAVLTIGSIKIGLLICYDIRFPEVTRAYIDEGCSCLAVASAFPLPRLDHFRTLLQARAIENQMYVVAANRCGKDGELWFMGNSTIIDPWGTIKARCGESAEEIIIHRIDLGTVEQVRSYIPCLDNRKNLKQLSLTGTNLI